MGLIIAIIVEEGHKIQESRPDTCSLKPSIPALAEDIADQARCQDGGQDREPTLDEGFFHIVSRPAPFRVVQKPAREPGRSPCRKRG
jgi:hypothetical protein